jgi:hypothetical protein
MKWGFPHTEKKQKMHSPELVNRWLKATKLMGLYRKATKKYIVLYRWFSYIRFEAQTGADKIYKLFLKNKRKCADTKLRRPS